VKRREFFALSAATFCFSFSLLSGRLGSSTFLESSFSARREIAFSSSVRSHAHISSILGSFPSAMQRGELCTFFQLSEPTKRAAEVTESRFCLPPPPSPPPPPPHPPPSSPPSPPSPPPQSSAHTLVSSVFPTFWTEMLKNYTSVLRQVFLFLILRFFFCSDPLPYINFLTSRSSRSAFWKIFHFFFLSPWQSFPLLCMGRRESPFFHFTFLRILRVGPSSVPPLIPLCKTLADLLATAFRACFRGELWAVVYLPFLLFSFSRLAHLGILMTALRICFSLAFTFFSLGLRRERVDICFFFVISFDVPLGNKYYRGIRDSVPFLDEA